MISMTIPGPPTKMNGRSSAKKQPMATNFQKPGPADLPSLGVLHVDPAARRQSDLGGRFHGELLELAHGPVPSLWLVAVETAKAGTRRSRPGVELTVGYESALTSAAFAIVEPPLMPSVLAALRSLPTFIEE